MKTWFRLNAGTTALAGLVLVIAMATSATAALVITGKNIKNGTVTTKDVKNGTLRVDDLSKKARASLQGTPQPGFIGSACQVPAQGSGKVTMHVAGDGVITLICTTAPVSGLDVDGDVDGFIRSQECNDTKPLVNPAAVEVNGDLVDNDCDGTADDGTSTADNDGDGQSIQQGDCDDTDATVAAGNADTFGNGIDNNCDGVDG